MKGTFCNAQQTLAKTLSSIRNLAFRYQGRSIREDFMAINGRLEAKPLTDAQIAAILRENAGGSSWSVWQLRQVSPEEETAGEYRRADGHGFAFMTGNAISLFGTSFDDMRKQADEFRKQSRESGKTNKP
jgi:hypothetical protein